MKIYYVRATVDAEEVEAHLVVCAKNELDLGTLLQKLNFVSDYEIINALGNVPKEVPMGLLGWSYD